MSTATPITDRAARIKSRSRFATGLLLGGLLVFGAAGVCRAHSTAGAPSAGRFSLKIIHRVFDGVQIDSVLLVSPEFSMMTDTFGAWLPPEEDANGPDFTLHSRRFEKVRFDICRVSRSDASTREQDWNSYVHRVQRSLGEDAAVSELADSTKGPPAVAILGWPTREALFVQPAQGNAPAMAERHVLASGPAGAVLFVLSGPYEQVTRADDDFRFFLARLSKN
jgi:hypothetical protein